MTEQVQTQGGQAELDTFESPVQLSQEAIDKAMGKPEPEAKEAPAKEEPKKEEVDPDSQVNLLDDDEVKELPKKEEEKKEEEPKKDDKLPEPEAKEESKNDKSIRVKDGDKAVDIAPEATVKVKVKGKSEFVAIKDLMENYSGKKAWDTEFQKIAEEKKQVQTVKQKHQEEIQEIQQHFGTIASLLDADDKNPMEALQYLVEMSGRNVYDFNKKMHSFMQTEIQKLSEMSEAEQALYWKEQELNYVRGTQKAKEEQQSKRQAHMEALKKADTLREKYGVTKEKYTEVHDKLMKLAKEGKIALKPNQITIELVVEQAAYDPIFEKAAKFCEPYGEELGDEDLDSLTAQMAHEMFQSPKLKEEDALVIAAKKLGFDVQTVADEVKELERKVATKPVQAQATKPKSDKPESFEDFDTF